MRPRVIAIAFLIAALLSSNSAAQVVGDSKLRDSKATLPIRASIARIDFSRIDAVPASAPAMQADQNGRQRSIGRKIAGGAIGGVGGFFAGGYIGAKIDGDCGGCDDPGFKGALIGAPIGAVVGAILGVKFF